MKKLNVRASLAILGLLLIWGGVAMLVGTPQLLIATGIVIFLAMLASFMPDFELPNK